MGKLRDQIYNGLKTDKYITALDKDVLYNIYALTGQGQKEIDLSVIAQDMGAVNPAQNSIDTVADSVKRLQGIRVTSGAIGCSITQAVMSCNIYEKGGHTYINNITLAQLPDMDAVNNYNPLADIMANMN